MKSGRQWTNDLSDLQRSIRRVLPTTALTEMSSPSLQSLSKPSAALHISRSNAPAAFQCLEDLSNLTLSDSNPDEFNKGSER